MKSFLLALLILALPLNSLASVTYLNRGQVATYDGYLFDEPAAKAARTDAIDANTYKLLNTSLQQSLDLEKATTAITLQQRDLFRDRNDDLAKELTSSHATTNFERCLWFALGVFASVGAFYGVQKVTK